MTPTLMRISMLAAAAMTMAAAPRQSRAQLPIPSFGIAGGVSQYKLGGGTGTTPFGAIRVDVPLLTFVAEGSLGAFRPKDASGTQRTYVIPEAQLQFQLFPVLVRPYFGVGAGWVRAVSGSGPDQNDLSLSASAGVRVGVPLTGFGVRAEVRGRTIGGTTNHAVEWTLGVNF